MMPVRGTSWVCTFTPDASVSSADTVVVPGTSAARPADQAAPRADDTGYRTFLQAFSLCDVVHQHPVPQGTYSCF